MVHFDSLISEESGKCHRPCSQTDGIDSLDAQAFLSINAPSQKHAKGG